MHSAISSTAGIGAGCLCFASADSRRNFAKMPLSAAERQRRYKEKIKKDPLKYEEYKRKKRATYHTAKKLVKDLTPKEKLNARVIWKLRKRDSRSKRKNLNRVLDMTPPSSPIMLIPDEDVPPNVLQVLPQNADMSGIETPENSANPSNKSKKSPGRNTPSAGRSKLSKENIRLQEENEKLRKKLEKYKKRFQRGDDKKKDKKIDDKDKYKNLSNAIKDRYQKTKKRKEKKILKEIFEDIDPVQKKVMITESLGITGRLRNNIRVKNSTTNLNQTIKIFFEREDISRATAGKKETITRHGEKMQRRYLLDSMKNLYKTFMSENPGIKCSYYYLTRNRPFFVVKPSVSGREMCLCKTHINPTYKASALKNKNIIDTDDINKLITATVCNPKDESCMYGNCTLCCDKQIAANGDNDRSIIQWKEWGRIEESYEKDGNKLKVFKNVKLDKEGTVKELLMEFNKELNILKKHIYNMKTQFTNFRQAVDNLQQTEAVIVADFSENYSCKLHEEIQAHHFGGSRQQVSLHTVVAYVNGGEQNKKIESYCTVSSNTNHQPAAIWAHLEPVLKDIRSSYPEIKFVHFFTDGPFSQYRQKQNFYLSSNKIFDYGFKALTWSFFEAGHGKGPADGIGGYLKRSADDLVARGEDITSAYKFYEVLKDVSKIKLHFINNEKIEDSSKQMPAKIQPLIGTKDVHQIFTAVRGELKYRNLSCFCSRGFCDCLSPKIYHPLTNAQITGQITRQKKMNVNSIKNMEEAESVVNDENSNAYKLIDEDVSMTSGEDFLLSNYSYGVKQKSLLKEIGLLDLSQARSKNWYDIIYRTPDTSDDDESTADNQQPSGSGQQSNNKANQGVRPGDFLLVNVTATKGKIFKYACIVDDLHDDGEIRVTFLRSAKNKKNTFRLEKSDVSDIDYTDIVKILSEPTITDKHGELYYVFENDVEVFEK